MDIENMPLVKALQEHANRGYIPFHMPGHKENRKEFEELDLIRCNLFAFDKTEVSGLDNLHLPSGPIKEAQEMAAKAFGAAKSYFLINGSTSGIYSMITGVTRPGDRIIVQRDCHRSIHMAAFIGQLETRYVKPKVEPEFGIPASLDVDDVVRAMDNNRDARAIVLVHPSYYGVCSDLEAIVEEAHKRSMLVLVDEAHGAHFPFGDGLPKTAMQCGADLSVTSVHKSLPAFTQASLLNVNKSMLDAAVLANLEFMLRMYQSTSPSYILMASIDAARSIMENSGRKLLEELLERIEGFKVKMKELHSFKILEYGLPDRMIAEYDRTKLVIHSALGGVRLAELLEKEHSIMVEMADIYNIVLITGVGDTEEHFEKLYQALEQIDRCCQNEIQVPEIQEPPGSMSYCSMRTAFYSKKRNIRLVEAAGMVCAEMVVPYPPGIPVLLPGELITKEMVNYITAIKNAGMRISGMEDATAENINVADVEVE